MADDALILELGGGAGVRVEWDLASLARLEGDDGRPFRLGGELDPARWEQARVLSGAFADGRLLAVAALRPAAARGHGDEAIAGAVIRDGEPSMLDEVLLSVEYGRDGEPRRVGLELYEEPDSLPVRIAGDVSEQRPGGEAKLALRAGGVDGSGVLVVLRPN